MLKDTCIMFSRLWQDWSYPSLKSKQTDLSKQPPTEKSSFTFIPKRLASNPIPMSPKCLNEGKEAKGCHEIRAVSDNARCVVMN
jgi:hypothetical protein